MKEFLKSPDLTYHIIAIQFPFVIFLILHCYQAYKLGFIEFKLIYKAWLVNLIYLICMFLLQIYKFYEVYFSKIIAFFDLLSMYLFLTAVLFSFNEGFLGRLKKININQIRIIFLISWLILFIPDDYLNFSYIVLKKFPIAVIDFSVITILALYFRELSNTYREKDLLFIFTILYAFLQFLSVLNPISFSSAAIQNLDLIGFTFGLIFKICILISLLLILFNISYKRNKEISDAKIQAEVDKDNMLNKLLFATKILDINKTDKSEDTAENQKNIILNNVLNECLNLVKEDFGYFARYHAESNSFEIEFVSEIYNKVKGFKYSADKGITGEAIAKRKSIDLNESTNYIKFSKLQFETNETDKNFVTEIDIDVKSAFAFPVILDNTIIGVYMIESKLPNFFKQIDVKIIETLVNQATVALKNIDLIKEVELSKTFYQTYQTFTKMITMTSIDAPLELRKIYRIILRHSMELFQGDIGNIVLYDKNKNNELTITESTNKKNIDMKLNYNQNICGIAVKGKTRYFIENIERAKHKHLRTREQFIGENMKCSLAIPLMINDNVFAVLNIESKEEGKIKKQDIDKIEEYTRQASIAMNVSRLFEDLNKHQVRLKGFAKIERDIMNSEFTLPQILETILDFGKRQINMKYGHILLLSSNFIIEKSLIVKKSTNISSENHTIPIDSLSSLAVEKRQPVYFSFSNKVNKKGAGQKYSGVYIPKENDIKRLNLKNLGEAKEIRSQLILPLIVPTNKLIGFFNIESEENDAFTEDDFTLLKALADAAAIAIHNNQQLEEVQIANKNKTIFLSNYSHEIRKPLNSIIGFANLLLKEKSISNSPREKDYLLTIINSSEILQRQVGTILDILKIERDNIDADYSVFDFVSVLDNVIKIYEDPIKRKGLLLKKLMSENFPKTIRLDRTKIESILINVIGNAVKFTREGVIKITANLEGNILEFIVEDTGIGISDEFLQEIGKKPFTQEKDRTKEFEGLGVGVHLSKKYVEILEGEMFYESKEKEWTKVTIRFKNVKVNQPLEIDTNYEISEFEFNNCRVLIVDDELNSRLILKETLSKISNNLEVFMAENGQEGLEKVETKVPDIIFMDIKMDIMDGIDATRKIKSLDNFKKVPIFAYTGSSYKRG
jgi:signal transduction histidine kinase/CheY-like chemotaxis protein